MENNADVDHIHDNTNTMDDNNDNNKEEFMDNLEIDAMGNPVLCSPPLSDSPQSIGDVNANSLWGRRNQRRP